VRCGGRDDAFHLDVQFLVTATAGAEFVVSEESHDLRWFAVQELPAGVERTVQELVQRSARRSANR
jgi:hypothetical protein